MAALPRAEPSYRIEIIGPHSREDNYSYLVIDNESGSTMAVDPYASALVKQRFDKLHKAESKIQMKGVLTTHGHWDHSGGNGAMLEYFPKIKIYGGKLDAKGLGKDTFTDIVGKGDTLPLGKTKIQIYDVPCHTRGHVLYYVTNDDDSNPSLFTGDTLFVGGVGKFFSGTAEEMQINFDLIAGFPLQTKLYTGHEYTRSNYAFCVWVEPKNQKLLDQIELEKKGTIWSTIGDELETNCFMRTQQLIERVQQLVGGGAQIKTKVDAMKWLRTLKNQGKHRL